MSDTAKRDAVLNRYSDNGWDYPDHEAMAWRIVELEAAVERVRALHTPTPDVGSAVWTDAAGQPLLAVCHACGDDYPCSTAQALQEAA